MSTVLRLPPPTGGTSQPAGTQAVAKDKAVALSDFLIDQPGRLVMRGPLGNPITLVPSTRAVHGIFTFGEKFAVLDGTTSLVAVLDGNAGTASTFTAFSTPPMMIGRSVRFGSRAYGCADGSPSGLGLQTWDGTTSPTSIAAVTGPLSPVCVEVHLNRLFVGGGTPISGGSFNANKLYWSDSGVSPPTTVAHWQDDVSGLDNQLVVGDDGDAITGLASFQRQLLVFKNNSIWQVLGDTPATFSLRRVVSNLGCANQVSILVADDFVLFAGSNGQPMLYDGSAIQRLWGYPGVLTGSYATIVRLSNDYFLVTDGTTAAMLYVPTRSWVSLPLGANQIVGGQTVTMRQTELGKPFMFDGRYARSLNSLTAFGNGTEQNTAGTTVAITPSVTHRLAELDTPLYQTTLDRLCADYFLHKTGGTGTPSWTAALTDSMGNALATKTLAAGATAVLQRSVQDLFAPTSDVQVAITYAASGGVPTLDVATLQDVWIEYDQAQRR